VGTTKWPDPSTGAASASEQETVTVSALGQTRTFTDRNGNIHTLTYDVLGRLTSDAVTTLGSGVDGGVRRIEYAYDGQGNAYLITSYDAASGGNVVNQVQREFNGLGQMKTEYQQHGAAVNTGTSPKVQYGWSEMASGANHSRLTSITYPSGYVLTFNYSSGLNSDVSRLSSLSDSTGTLEAYDHLGIGTVVRRAHSQPGVDLTFIKQSGESNGDAGDQYTGLDRFGRVVDQRWIKSGSSLDRFQYGYDRNSNRLWRDNLVSSAMGELYGYDNLNQLTSFDRGTLNGTKTGLTGSASRSQDFDFDAQGNWDSLTNDGGSPQTRTHNAQNEVTAVSGATSPSFDANGNMTQAETGLRYVWDAWNRLVAVKDSAGTTTLKTYSHDGLNRRVTEAASGTTTDLFYSSAWQVLEEKVGSDTKKRYVWSPVYVDALILRDRDTDGNGSLEERLWVQQDANFNVTALVNGSGTVVERYAYDPFGVRTVYDASYNVRAGGSSYDFQHGFQGLWFDVVAGLNEADRRWYSPTLGRWASIDPIYYSAGDNVLYRFVGNGPTNATDPTGLDEIEHRVVGAVTNLYYVNWLGKKWHIGVMVPINGENFARRYVVGQGFLYVPMAKVEQTAGFWDGTPTDWDKWFRENGTTAEKLSESSIKNLGMQAGTLRAGHNDFAVAQSQVKSLSDTVMYWYAGAGFNVSPSDVAMLGTLGAGGSPLTQYAKTRLAKDLGGIPRSAQPIRQGNFKGVKWWEYKDHNGKVKIVVEHPDGSVHIGTPKPQSLHGEGKGPPKYYPVPGTGHVGDD
jgi:RHS repeat-associated protein